MNEPQFLNEDNMPAPPLETVTQDLYCHSCGRYVWFTFRADVSGNMVIECPDCGHEHCRIVRDGVITKERWDRRNNNNATISPASTTTSSSSLNQTFDSGGGDVFLQGSWANSSATGNHSF